MKYIDNALWMEAVAFLSGHDPSSDWSESIITMWVCGFAMEQMDKQAKRFVEDLEDEEFGIERDENRRIIKGPHATPLLRLD